MLYFKQRMFHFLHALFEIAHAWFSHKPWWPILKRHLWELFEKSSMYSACCTKQHVSFLSLRISILPNFIQKNSKLSPLFSSTIPFLFSPKLHNFSKFDSSSKVIINNELWLSLVVCLLLKIVLFFVIAMDN